jgi:tyrosinase
MRTRRDVWKLAADPTDKTLYWYSIAVAEMQSRMFDNVNSWKFQAAVHGYDASLYPPLRSGENLPSQPIQLKYWDNCQHASWWFLPWHRIYVFLFESMCRDIITQAGGPGDWALPYWDYSHPSNTTQRTLPTPFRNATNGSSTNPLYAIRAAGVNTGGVVGTDAQSENTTCLKSPFFSGKLPNGFGGGASPVMQFSHYTGSCENGPHNYMHDAIGGPSGWMDNPDAAALDPIFWLHHSNIDRLWVIWQSIPQHVAPPDSVWNNQTFDFFDNAGQPKTYTVSQVLKTIGPLCDYIYEDTTNPLSLLSPIRLAFSSVRFGAGHLALPKPTSQAREMSESLMESSMRISQMIGATDSPGVTLSTAPISVALEMHAPALLPQLMGNKLSTLEAEVAPKTQHVYLALENVTAKTAPIHTYGVYINVPLGSQPESHPELLAGLIPRFGLVKASKPDSNHGGQGLNLSFDISGIVATLEADQTWDPVKLQITFVPHDEQALVAMQSDDQPAVMMQPVEVGRVSVYTQ